MKVLFGVDPTLTYASDAEAPFSYGDLYILDGQPGVYEFGEADETIAAGNHVFITKTDGGLTLMDTTEAGATPKPVGVVCADLTAGVWGWVWRGMSRFEAIVVNAVSADTALTTTATAGDAGTGGDAIPGYRTIDAGVTDTRVTVEANTLLYAGS